MLSACWKWDKEISENVIDIFLKDVLNNEVVPGTVFNGREEGLRKNGVVLFPSLHFMAGVLGNYAFAANHLARWNRDLKGIDCVQYARYQEGEFYDWHTDCATLSEAPLNRKLTVVTLLNEPTAFEGGVLEIEGLETQPVLQKGSVVVFPSHLRHRVTPVTKGVRESATCWVLGTTSW